MAEDYNADDYEGGKWLSEREKPKRKFTKEDAIYGQWAVHSSDEEFEGKKRTRHDKDYTAPIQFISRTVMGGDSSVKKVVETDGDDDDNGRGGLGSKKKKKKKSQSADGNGKKVSQSQESKLPSKFGAKQRYIPDKRYSREEEELNAKADFEVHTKGIGSKLLAKMGYKGGGLGRLGQGMSAPIEVVQRPKGLGLGAGDFDEKTSQQKKAIVISSEDEDEQDEEGGEEEEEEEARWKKGAAPRRRTKTVYEVINEAEEEKPQLVVDMRGPQVRTMTDVSSALLAGDDKKVRVGPMPELRYNMRLLVDMSELSIQNIDRNLRTTKDSIVGWAHEKEKLTKQVKSEDTQIESMRDLLEILTKCQEKVQAKEITLESMMRVFDLLQHKFLEEYVIYKIKYLALELVGPLLKARTAGWNPIVVPAQHVLLFEGWRDVLSNDVPTDFSDHRQNDVDVYLQLSHDVLMPPIRTALSNLWHPRNCDPVINLITVWTGVMPQPMVDDIFYHPDLSANNMCLLSFYSVLTELTYNRTSCNAEASKRSGSMESSCGYYPHSCLASSLAALNCSSHGAVVSCYKTEVGVCITGVAPSRPISACNSTTMEGSVRP